MKDVSWLPSLKSNKYANQQIQLWLLHFVDAWYTFIELSISWIIPFVLYLEPATFQKDLGHSADNKVMVMFLFSQKLIDF